MPVSHPRLRILIADDNLFLGDILVRFFRRAGHEIEHVPDGIEAWESMSKDIGHFHVLITDHQMPHLGGLELVDLLRQANYPGRIVVHSGSLTEAECRSYEGFRVDQIVRKSARAEELLAAVVGLAVGA